MRQLPNLKAMRVLAVVAANKSFTRAADELGVTQSAVSKQIANLETELGRPLFRRFHRRVELTAFGAQMAAAAHSALEHLKTQIRAIDPSAPEHLQLAGDADFLQLWLMPRLGRFEAQKPNLRVSIRSEVGMNQPPAETYDCAILWGGGDWQGCRFETLLTNSVFPVASPALLPALKDLQSLDELDERLLIHDQTRFWWQAFRHSDGGSAFDPGYGRIYNQTVLCLDAAVRGQGLTIGDEVSTRAYLEDGRLTCPFNQRLPSKDAYFFVTPSDASENENVQVFLDWIKSEALEHRRWYREFWAVN